MEKIEAEKFFRQQKRYRLFYILLIAFLYFISAHGVGFQAGTAFSAIPKKFYLAILQLYSDKRFSSLFIDHRV